MLKRITSITFILFANIIMLAHIFVPHHHHKSEVCLSKTDCMPIQIPHPDLNMDCACEKEEANHHDQSKSNAEYCKLNQILVIPSKETQLEGTYFLYLSNHLGFGGFQALLSQAMVLDLSSNLQLPIVK